MRCDPTYAMWHPNVTICQCVAVDRVCARELVCVNKVCVFACVSVCVWVCSRCRRRSYSHCSAAPDVRERVKVQQILQFLPREFRNFWRGGRRHFARVH